MKLLLTVYAITGQAYGLSREMAEQGISLEQPECYNADTLFRDTGGDSCEWYAESDNWLTCGDYDTDDFKAHDMCCACGGGSSMPVRFTVECQDKDNGAKDNGGDGCAWYSLGTNSDTCGVFNDRDFEAK